jgi:hypothetical protein
VGAFLLRGIEPRPPARLLHDGGEIPDAEQDELRLAASDLVAVTLAGRLSTRTEYFFPRFDPMMNSSRSYKFS